MTSLIPDPEDPTQYIIGNAAVGAFGQQVNNVVLRNVHNPSQCAGRHCLVHNPSDHHMREWPLNWRDDTGVMERLCPEHGIGHPDPDDAAFHKAAGRDYMTFHGCCGCCVAPEDPDE